MLIEHILRDIIFLRKVVYVVALLRVPLVEFFELEMVFADDTWMYLLTNNIRNSLNILEEDVSLFFMGWNGLKGSEIGDKVSAGKFRCQWLIATESYQDSDSRSTQFVSHRKHFSKHWQEENIVRTISNTGNSIDE